MRIAPSVALLMTLPVAAGADRPKGDDGEFRITGQVEAAQAVDLYPRAGGFVTEIQVQSGDRVKGGQVLARLDRRERIADVAIREAKLRLAQVEFERARAERKGLEGKAAERADWDLRAADVKLELAKAELEVARLAAEATNILAPFDGIVIRRGIDVGGMVLPRGSNAPPLFRLIAAAPMRVAIDVPEASLSRLKIGVPARVEVRALPDLKLTAKLVQIDPVVEKGTIRARLQFDTNEARLLPGMQVQVVFPKE